MSSYPYQEKGRLNLQVEIRDFDLERMGVSLSVLDPAKQHRLSEGYLRMTLLELGTLVKALRSRPGEIDLSTPEVVTNDQHGLVQSKPKPALPEIKFPLVAGSKPDNFR